MNPVVEQIIGKLIIDPAFRQSFKADRRAALAGYRLTAVERNGLMKFRCAGARRSGPQPSNEQGDPDGKHVLVKRSPGDVMMQPW